MSGRLALHAPARARRSSGAGVWWWKRAADQSKRERASTRHTARKDRVNTVKERACARGILPPPHLGLTHRLLPLAIRISPWHWRPRCVPPLGSPSVLFLLDFFPHKVRSRPGSLQLITQVGRGWIVGQSVVALRWNWIWVCQTHRRPAAGSSSVSARSSPYSWYGIAASAFCWRRKCPPRQRTAQCRPIRHEGASAARRLCLARAFASTGCG